MAYCRQNESNFITNVLSINKNTLPEGTRGKKKSDFHTFIHKNHPGKNTGTFSVETTRNDHDLPLAQNYQLKQQQIIFLELKGREEKKKKMQTPQFTAYTIKIFRISAQAAGKQ